MEKNHFDLTKRNIGELVIKKINDFECKIQDQKGDVFNGFILAITKKDEDKRICDISFQKSTNDNKFPVRLSFRKIDRNNFDKEIDATRPVIIDFLKGENGYREFWQMIDFLYKSRELLDIGDFSELKIVSDKQLVDSLSNPNLLNQLQKNPELLKNFKSNLLDLINKGAISDQDINNIAFRKEQLKTFKKMLNENLIEDKWQKFFKKNDWIFGYGLDYKYIESSNREVEIGYGKIDFASFNKFTVLIEIKTPQTPLLEKAKKDEKSPNRSDAWSLSNELVDAVSQILAYKINWQIEAENRDNREKYGRGFLTADPKTILVIGKFCDLSKDIKELKNNRITKETFEMFRRDSRNIEIITFDELYERAFFIVEGEKVKQKTINIDENDDLTF